MPFAFDHPLMLLIALLAIPVGLIGWWATRGVDLARRITILVVRTGLVMAIAIALAGPHRKQVHDQLTVIGLLDISGSVQRFADIPALPTGERATYIEHLRRWFREATETREPDDRFGLIVFDGEAVAVSAPTSSDYVDDMLDVRMREGTNIAEALRLGLAMFPPDTAKRIVLVTDGNETSGDVVQVARRAIGGAAGETTIADLAEARANIPIDVLPIDYRVASDVQVVRVEAPSNAQPGQTVTVRIVMEATQPAAGRLSLRREGSPIDLNGPGEPGSARLVSLPAGQSVHLAQVELGETPVNRFEAVFEPVDARADALVANNRAQTFTATPSKGSVLIADAMIEQRPNILARYLRNAEIPVSTVLPDLLPADLLSYQNYDLVVLDNVSAAEVGEQRDELLRAYVEQLGGGLIMLGGESSFGAGGWNGSEVEKVMPLELDPPRELRLPEAALVLVLDKSGSMHRPVAGARASQQEVANAAAARAIESLRAASLVGVVAFDSSAYLHVPLQRNSDPAAIAERVRAIRPDGGTNIAPALRKAHEMLRDVDADRKRVVCLSDGQSMSTPKQLQSIVSDMLRDDIRVSTIAVGDSADYETLKLLADAGEGEFYPVYNPRSLPRVMVDSVQVINKPLIKEVAFRPVVQPTGSTLTRGLRASPQLGGLIVTAPRPDVKGTIELTHPDGEPLLAVGQFGLGRTAAFTSDVGGDWTDEWIRWPTAETMFIQLARSTARPAVSSETELTTVVEGDQLQITLDVASTDEGFLDYLLVDGTIYQPNGEPRPVRLRQTGPGRYEAAVPAPEAGNYVVALNPRRGQRQLAPVIGGASRATGDEFRRYTANVARLEELASMTGGRRLDLRQPQAVDLYDRDGMPTSISILPAWRDLLWIALAVLMLDIAARRIAWTGSGVRTAVRSAVRAARPSRVKGQEVATTLASLRQVSSEFDAKQARQSEGVEKLEAQGGPVAYVPKQTPRREKSGPSERTGVGAILGRRSSRTGSQQAGDDQPRQAVDEEAKRAAKADADPAKAATASDAKNQADEPEHEGSTATTSSLLAAKRAARKRTNPNEE